MNNIIFCFTGTGNSLETAEKIAGVIENTRIYPMSGENGRALEKEKFDRVGFVFPVYFGGLPQQADRFLKNLDLGMNKESYLFAVGTYGGIPANAIRQTEAILKEKGAGIDYGRFIKMPDNYILMYDPGKDHSKVQNKYREQITGVGREIGDRGQRPAKDSVRVVNWYNWWMLKRLPGKAAFYHISDTCTGCGVCRDICPAGNIALKDGRPVIGGNCQSCVGCIQYCPQRAINYKDKTEKRGRYRNPQYTAGDLAEFQRRNWQQDHQGRM